MAKTRPPKNIQAFRGRRQTLWLCRKCWFSCSSCLRSFMPHPCCSPYRGSRIRKWKGWLDEFMEENPRPITAAVQWNENLVLEPAGEDPFLLGNWGEKVQFLAEEGKLYGVMCDAGDVTSLPRTADRLRPVSSPCCLADPPCHKLMSACSCLYYTAVSSAVDRESLLNLLCTGGGSRALRFASFDHHDAWW